MRRAIVSFVIAPCFVIASFGWVTPLRPVVLRARSLNLRVMIEGNARTGLRYELHKAMTFDWQKMRRTGASEKESLKSTTTDSLGLLSFGEVRPGRYWIVPKGGSVGGSVPVEVNEPMADGRMYRVLIMYNAEGDVGAGVEEIDPNRS